MGEGEEGEDGTRVGRDGKEKREGKQSDEVKEVSRRLHKEEGWRGRGEGRGGRERGKERETLHMVPTDSLESFLEVPGHLTFDGVQNDSLGDLEKMVPL